MLTTADAVSRRHRILSATSSRSLRYLPVTALLLDTLVISLAVGLAALGRQRLTWFDGSVDVRFALRQAAPLILVGWVATMYLLGAYRDDVFGAGSDEFKRIFKSGAVAGGLVGVGCYLTKLDLARGFFLLVFVLGVLGLALGRAALRRLLHQARRAGRLRQQVLLVGTPSHVDEIAGVLRRETWLGYDVLGALVPSTFPLTETVTGVPVVGTTEEVTAAAVSAGVDVIFFAGGGISSGNQMRKIVWELEEHDIQIVVAPSVSDISSERIRVRPVGGLPLMHLDPPTWHAASRLGKRAFDILGSLMLLLGMAPLLAGVALQIKLHDRGPVLFRQVRTGLRGRQFSCLKFRTMVTDAEDRLPDLQQHQQFTGGLFKMKQDPRITQPGRWLRRFSVDELPQLLNVLRGDMSLVGPRPPLPCEVATYGHDTSRRLHVRPGLTGLWQVSGRSDLPYDEAIRLDLYYVDNWSMLQDLIILTRTAGAVLGRRGAY